MTPHAQALRAYAQTTAPTRTARGTEYEVFARITRQLISAARSAKQDFPALTKALHDNRQLWTLLAADVADDLNALPDELRGRIFYLSEFTRLHTSKVLKREASVAPLIEVNTAIMRGLRQEGGAK